MQNRSQFFSGILKNFCLKLNWAYHDRFGDDFPVGQLGVGFTLYMLNRFGKTCQSKSFYAQKYLKAFPRVPEQLTRNPHITGERRAMISYSVRTFDRFLEWFGMVSVEKSKDHQSEKDLVQTTGIFGSIIEVED